MFVVNTAINLQIFRGRYHFILRAFTLLLTLKNFTQGVTWQIMPRPSEAVDFTLCAHKLYAYRKLVNLIGAFQNHADLVLCIIGSDENNMKLYVLDLGFFLQRVNKLSNLNQ